MNNSDPVKLEQWLLTRSIFNRDTALVLLTGYGYVTISRLRSDADSAVYSYQVRNLADRDMAAGRDLRASAFGQSDSPLKMLSSLCDFIASWYEAGDYLDDATFKPEFYTWLDQNGDLRDQLADISDAIKTCY